MSEVHPYERQCSRSGLHELHHEQILLLQHQLDVAKLIQGTAVRCLLALDVSTLTPTDAIHLMEGGNKDGV